jgi:hypothetical protein
MNGNLAYSVRAQINAGDRDLTDVVLRLQGGATMTGRVDWNGAPPQVLGVIAEPARGSTSLGTPRSWNAPGQVDTFTIDGILPGSYLLRVQAFGAQGIVKSVRWNGRDYTTTPFDVSAEQELRDVVITFTPESSALTGFVRDRAGMRAPGAAVVIFPVEREQWANYGLTPRRIKSGTAGLDGSYRVAGVPAGDYFVVAVDAAQVNAWQDPAFLAAAAGVATRITVAWGETKTQDLSPAAVR